jgi:hypothetical protein
MRVRAAALATFVLILFVSTIGFAQAQAPKASKDTILNAADIPASLYPERVFFRGKTAPTQHRNTAGVHFADDMYVLAGLVDSSGYATSVKEKYQAYLITEVPLEIAGQHVNPGAYGFGFLSDGKFVLMDLGNHDLFRADAHHDADMKHPVPFQIVAGSREGSYLIYSGRNSMEFKRAQ